MSSGHPGAVVTPASSTEAVSTHEGRSQIWVERLPLYLFALISVGVGFYAVVNVSRGQPANDSDVAERVFYVKMALQSFFSVAMMFLSARMIRAASVDYSTSDGSAAGDIYARRVRVGHTLGAIAISGIAVLGWWSLAELARVEPGPQDEHGVRIFYARVTAHAVVTVALIWFGYQVLRIAERLALPQFFYANLKAAKLALGIETPFDFIRSIFNMIFSRVRRKAPLSDASDAVGAVKEVIEQTNALLGDDAKGRSPPKTNK